jgi:hypothetical protein
VKCNVYLELILVRLEENNLFAKSSPLSNEISSTWWINTIKVNIACEFIITQ